MLLNKAYEALPASGARIICEHLIDHARQTGPDALFSSLHMLIAPRMAMMRPAESTRAGSRTQVFCEICISVTRMRALGNRRGEIAAPVGGCIYVARERRELAAEVVRQKPDVIYAVTTRMVRALKEATTTIPIVGFMADPLAYGIVTSLARPPGNVTGVSTDGGIEFLGKQLGLLRDLLPKLSRVGYLASRAVWDGPSGVAMRAAGQSMGVEVRGAILEVAQEAEYRSAFALMKEQAVDGLVVSDQGENVAHRRVIVHLAAESRLPVVYPYRVQVEVGGLINYGAELRILVANVPNRSR